MAEHDVDPLLSLNPNFNRAAVSIIEAANAVFVEYGLDGPESDTVLAKVLLMAIASHAKVGRERNVLTIVVRYLRDGLAIACQEVAAKRLAALQPAGRA
jgi:hypothetical protein